MDISSGPSTEGRASSQASRSLSVRHESATMVCPWTVTARLSARSHVARTGGTGLGDQVFFQLVLIIRFIDMFMDVFDVAAQEISGDAFEASPANGGGRLMFGKMAAKKGAFHAKEQQVALRLGEFFERQGEVECEPIIRGGSLQNGGIVVD